MGVIDVYATQREEEISSGNVIYTRVDKGHADVKESVIC
jgi:hypothetical protein